MSLTTLILLGTGVVAALCIWGIRAFIKRQGPQPVASHDDYLDQTCELNHNPEQQQ